MFVKEICCPSIFTTQLKLNLFKTPFLNLSEICAIYGMITELLFKKAVSVLLVVRYSSFAVAQGLPHTGPRMRVAALLVGRYFTHFEVVRVVRLAA